MLGVIQAPRGLVDRGSDSEVGNYLGTRVPTTDRVEDPLITWGFSGLPPQAHVLGVGRSTDHIQT